MDRKKKYEKEKEKKGICRRKGNLGKERECGRKNTSRERNDS